jgi:hypothetical protein
MKTSLVNAFGLKLFGGIVGGVMLLAIIAHFAPGASMNSATGAAYNITPGKDQGMASGAWDIGNVALTIAHHLTGPQLNQFDPTALVALGIVTAPKVAAASTNTTSANMNMSAINANGNTAGTNTSNAMDGQILQRAKDYWQKQCGGVCPIPFQCAMFVETVYGAAGHPLPQTHDAIGYWEGYKNMPGWEEIPVSAKRLPAVGDMVVWDGGEVSKAYPNGIGHIAIVVAVQPPGATQNGSVTVAQANALTTAAGNLTTPDPLVPTIKMPGVRLYQMPITPNYDVQTWGPLPGEEPYHVLGYIRNTALLKDAQFANIMPGVGYSVVGKPTITVDLINSILAYYKSPAAGKGQALYDLGVKYGIDPVYALAFFQHESTFGTSGEAVTTLALGNERCTSDSGRACVDLARGGYTQMQSWEDGFEHWYTLIKGSNLYVGGGRMTVDQIIPIYAPASENDVNAYIQAIKQSVDLWRSGKVHQ